MNKTLNNLFPLKVEQPNLKSLISLNLPELAQSCITWPYLAKSKRVVFSPILV